MIKLDKKKLEITQKTANQIKYYRTLEGFSQKSLAISTGLNPTFLGHIERSLKCPTIDTLYKISSALNISLSQLLDFEGEETVDENEKLIAQITQSIHGLSTQELMELAEIIEKIISFKRKN